MTNTLDDFTDYDDLVPTDNIDVEDSDMDDLVPASLKGDDVGDMGEPEDTESEDGDNETPIGTTTSDRLLADKYKSVEELERGYKELQAYATRLQQGKVSPAATTGTDFNATQQNDVVLSGEDRDAVYARVKDDYSKRYYEYVDQNYDHETAQQKAWDDAVYQDRIIQQRVNEALKSALPQVYQTVGVDIIGREVDGYIDNKDTRIASDSIKAELKEMGITDEAWLNIDPQTKKVLANSAYKMAIGSYYQNRAKGKPNTPDVPPTSVAGKGSTPHTAADLNPQMRAYAAELMSRFGWTEEQAVKSLLKNTSKK